jgi:MFS family permease
MALHRTVLMLGLVSLLTDLSSEMIYPLLPAFVAVTLGAGPKALGMIEGAAEATASVLKVVSGKLADRLTRRKPLIVVGYGLSGMVRPLIAVAGSWLAILAVRMSDRVGKGLRTSPRDALIADVTSADQMGRAFGLHRAMDNAGGVLGPLAAAALLALGFGARDIFWFAAIPAAVVMFVVVFGVREPTTVHRHVASQPDHSRGKLGPSFRGLMVPLILFALANSSDAFLLLRLSDTGLSQQGVVLAYSAYGLLRTLAVYFGGRLADRYERRSLLGVGWSLYALSYAALGFVTSPLASAVLVALYALHYGFTEPTERALVASFAPPGQRGAAFGWYHGLVGGAALPSSLFFGAVWSAVGPAAAFGAGAALALVAVAALSRVRQERMA